MGSSRTAESKPLPPEQIRVAMDALQNLLQELIGNTAIAAHFGSGCQLHPDLLGAPMQLTTAEVDDFIRRAIRQNIVLPGESHLHFQLTSMHLLIVFGGNQIRIEGPDENLVRRFVRSSQLTELFPKT